MLMNKDKDRSEDLLGFPADPAKNDTFRLHTQARRAKLAQFFGDEPPIDISMAEIERHGLKALLQSRVPLCYFLYMLLEDYNSENLFFYVEVDQFETYPFQSKSQLLSTGIHLYEMYIREDSDFEVNIDDKVRRPILPSIQMGDRFSFSEAKAEVFKLMESSYSKFRRSSIYADMRLSMGDANIYSKKVRNEAVIRLIQSLDKTTPMLDMSSPRGYKNEMIRAMVHEFCRTRLQIDFRDRKPEEVQRANATPVQHEGPTSRAATVTPSANTQKRGFVSRITSPFRKKNKSIPGSPNTTFKQPSSGDVYFGGGGIDTHLTKSSGASGQGHVFP